MQTVLSVTMIDNKLFDIKLEVAKHEGIHWADRDMSPLYWYVNTGRASAEFLHKLFSVKPYLIARDILKGGTDEEIIDRICKRIGCKRYEF